MLQCQSCAFVTSACDASLWDYGSLTIPFLRNGPCDVRHENSKNSRIDKPTWHWPIQRPPLLRKPYWGSHSQWSTSLRHNGRLGCASSLPHIYKPPNPPSALRKICPKPAVRMTWSLPIPMKLPMFSYDFLWVLKKIPRKLLLIDAWSCHDNTVHHARSNSRLTQPNRCDTTWKFPLLRQSPWGLKSLTWIHRRLRKVRWIATVDFKKKKKRWWKTSISTWALPLNGPFIEKIKFRVHQSFPGKLIV